ncbi:hypothetical protein [Nonomuraea sp. NPDC003754]
MKILACAALATMSLGLALAGCGAQQPSVGTRPTPFPSHSASFEITVRKKGEKVDIPNPGTGSGDARLLSALLTSFQVAQESRTLPGAVVALPVTDLGSMFIPLRMNSSPMSGAPACDKWTGGLWTTVLRDFNDPGVQMAVTTLETPAPTSETDEPRDAESLFRELRNPAAGVQSKRGSAASAGDHLIFSEAIITGPAQMLASLADTSEVASCRRLTGMGGDSGTIEPFQVPPIGQRSWAYRITGTREVPIWDWVQVVQTPRYVIEVRIPVQMPAPRSDPAKLLPQIAEAAYAKAEAALR